MGTISMKSEMNPRFSSFFTVETITLNCKHWVKPEEFILRIEDCKNYDGKLDLEFQQVGKTLYQPINRFINQSVKKSIIQPTSQ